MTSPTSKATPPSPPVTAIIGAGGEVTLGAVHQLSQSGEIVPVLIGNRSQITAFADRHEWDISGTRLIDIENEADAAETATALVRNGEAQILMKGDIHTDALMRAVIHRRNGILTGKRPSHIFQMTRPGVAKPLYVTDAALNIAPNVNARIAITKNAAHFVQRLGIEKPNIALLSATEVINQAMASSVEADQIARAAADELPFANISGPLALDLAVSADAARQKNIDDPVAGHADIIVVPNIETGNALFKAMVYFADALAAGLVLGAAAPIILTSRADPPEARIASLELAKAVL